jgi:hypothetical protein
MSHLIYCYAECRYAECRYAECRGAKSSGHRFCDVVSESTGGTVLGGAGPAVAAGRESAAGAADVADELKMRVFVCYKCLLI